MNREYVMLASLPKAEIPKGMLWSIKYDGMRAVWLPTTRGYPVHQVPFCADPKEDLICTGLFSRYGKVIHAPVSFLEGLPDFPLDGELWTGRGDFQRLISICRAHSADWTPVNFMVFDCPRYLDLFSDGRINNSIVKDKHICSADNVAYFGRNFRDMSIPFVEKYELLRDATFWNTYVRLVEQQYLSTKKVQETLEEELALGGEGLIGRMPQSVWVPKRSRNLIKLKITTDDEAVIMKHLPGEGKYLGMLGAYVVSWKGKQFKLSGMTDYDREHPLVPGTTITFRYRTLTNDGLPREARFVREYVFV